MELLELIQQKRAHLQRLATQRGAAGEACAVQNQTTWMARPKGPELRNLLAALKETGVDIRGSSFDAIAIDEGETVDFSDSESLRKAVERMTFIEVKTSNQARVKPGFDGFFFAITENEIKAADALGDRHRVALYNKASLELVLTSVPEILARARSSTWQLSVQL